MLHVKAFWKLCKHLAFVDLNLNGELGDEMIREFALPIDRYISADNAASMLVCQAWPDGFKTDFLPTRQQLGKQPYRTVYASLYTQDALCAGRMCGFQCVQFVKTYLYQLQTGAFCSTKCHGMVHTGCCPVQVLFIPTKYRSVNTKIRWCMDEFTLKVCDIFSINKHYKGQYIWNVILKLHSQIWIP